MYVCHNEARSCKHCCRGKGSKYYIFWVCVCSLMYPACNAYAPYCHLWHVWLYHIFPHYLTKVRISKKKKLNIKLCFDFLHNFSWRISHYKKKWAKYYHKSTYIFMSSTRYSCQIWIKLEYSWQILEKYSNIEFHENSPSGSRVVPYGEADRQPDGQTDWLADGRKKKWRS